MEKEKLIELSTEKIPEMVKALSDVMEAIEPFMKQLNIKSPTVMLTNSLAMIIIACAKDKECRKSYKSEEDFVKEMILKQTRLLTKLCKSWQMITS